MCDKNALNQIAVALGNQHRLEMLVLMMEGRYFTAKELSYGTGLLPSAATAHLKALVDSGLVKTFKQGKFKYFTLCSSDVALVVESVMCLASSKGIRRKLPEHEMCQARYCFNHLAGQLGVVIYKKLLESQYILTGNHSKTIHLTSKGEEWLHCHNLLPAGLQAIPDKAALQCMDWTERVPHLGGFLGKVLAEKFAKSEWIIRKKNSRAVFITQEGKNNLCQIFEINDSF